MKLKNLLSVLLFCAFLFNCGTAFDLASGGITEHQKEKPESKKDKRSIRPGVFIADLMFLYLAPVTLGVDFLTGGIYKTTEEISETPESNHTFYLNFGLESMMNSTFKNSYFQQNYELVQDDKPSVGTQIGGNYNYKNNVFNVTFSQGILDGVEPLDYNHGDWGFLSFFDNYVEYKQWRIHGGRIFNMNLKESTRFNLSAGIGFNEISYPNFKKIDSFVDSYGYISSNYLSSNATKKSVTFEFNPSIEFLLDKYFGCRLYGRVSLNKDYNYFGGGFEFLVGRLKRYNTKKQ